VTTELINLDPLNSYNVTVYAKTVSGTYSEASTPVMLPALSVPIRKFRVVLVDTLSMAVNGAWVQSIQTALGLCTPRNWVRACLTRKFIDFHV
jgi:hypothetical protein